MTEEQVARIVGALAVSYGKDLTTQTLDVYGMALLDLPLDDDVALVRRVVRTHQWWPSPATLREMVLADLGVLSPDEDQAWRMAKRAVMEAATRSLPGPVLEAVETVGRQAIATGVETTVAAQFREAYRRSKSRADREMMERTHEGLLEVGYARRLELSASDPGGAS